MLSALNNQNERIIDISQDIFYGQTYHSVRIVWAVVVQEFVETSYFLNIALYYSNR